MNVIDAILSIILIIAFVRGWLKGFIMEVVSLVAIFVAIYVAIHFSYFTSDFIHEHLTINRATIDLVSYCITFLGVLILVRFVGNLVTKLVEMVFLGWLNKILGAVFSTLKYALVLSVILAFFENMNNVVSYVDQSTIESSKLYRPVKNLAPIIYPSIDERIKNLKQDVNEVGRKLTK